MSERDLLEPLDPETRSLFDEADRHAEMPTAARSRLLDRVMTTVGGIPPGGTPSQGGGSGASLPAAPAASPVASASPTLSSAAKLTHLAAFAIGVTTGAAGYAAYDSAHPKAPPAPTAVAVETVSAKPIEPAAPAPATLLGAPSTAPATSPALTTAPATRSVAATPASASPSASAKEAITRDDELAAERLDLEAVRTALTRGQPAAALSTLEKHAQRFPRGRLGEERESLWIQALLASGRRGEAAQRAQTFRDRHPKSLLLPAIDAILGNSAGNQ